MAQDLYSGDQLDRPLNPFVSTDAEIAQKGGRLSPIQKKLVKFIEEETTKKRESQGFSSPKISESVILQNEKERKFFDKYQITLQDHDFLYDLVFHGSIHLNFDVLGHRFVVRSLTTDQRRNIGWQNRTITDKEILKLKIKSVAASLKNIDDINLDQNLLEYFIGKMQNKILDAVYYMHLLTERFKSELYDKLPNFCKTPTSKIRDVVCRSIQIPINDDRMKDMSEEQVYWHYINSMKEQEVDNETANSRLEYLSWFINPEMAKKVAEKKELHEESELNTIQKYSFMNGILDLIKPDMSPEEQTAIMDTIMYKMSSEHKEEPPAENQAFSNGNSMEQQPKTSDNVDMGMSGGSPNWYK